MEVRFGPFRVDPVRRRLLKDEALVPLTPKVFTLLQAFVDQPGRLLTKDMLLRTVWPNVTVEENSLTHSVATLRKALGDDIRAHSFIVTVPGQGYRFVASVHRHGGPSTVIRIAGDTACPVSSCCRSKS